MLFHFFECLQRSCEHCFFTFYRHRAARKQYLCVLSSPCSAETISLPFYRHRAARKQYFCRFIVTARRGNNIYAILSSPCGAGTISLPFYRRRAARKQYFCISSFAALLRALKFLFSLLQNGGTCWNGRGGACVPARTSAQRRFHPKMMCCHLQTRCFHPRKASLTMDAPSRGELAGKQVRPLPHLTTTSATFLQNHSSFRNERKAEHRSYHLPC